VGVLKRLATPRGWVWVFTGVCLLALGATLWSAYRFMAPAWPRKVVTLNFVVGTQTRVVYSAAQHDPEVIYDIKVEQQPRIERNPQAFHGQTLTEPYDTFIRQRWQRLAWTHAWALLFSVGSAIVLLQRARRL
jgi:hypothetical protein